VVVNLSSALLKSKGKAVALHSLVTLAVALVCGYLVYGIWYPGELAAQVGGTELFTLIMLVELGLGPLISLVIFNPAKPRAGLIRDYTVVGVIQLAALGYGLYAVAESRPVYQVFVKDRIEVVSAIELTAADYAGVSDKRFGGITWLGPERICVEFPTEAQARNALLFSAIYGKDIQLYPQYFRECHAGEIEAKTYSAAHLRSIIASTKRSAAIELPPGEFTWLPVKHRFSNWVEIYPNNDVTKAFSLSIDPFTTPDP
jgi:hypothetical protein